MSQSYFANVQFVKSITDTSDKPKANLPEIAVVGRSNVGKSSLINSIFNQKKLAKVSSTPGKTRLINYFEVENKFFFVDLPGYGFAKITKSESDKWKVMIENYLKDNPNLILVLVLIDARRNIMEVDKLMLDWLTYFQIQNKLVFTKSDKLSGNELSKLKSQIKKLYNEANIITFSNKSEQGRMKLVEYLKNQIPMLT